MSYIKRDFLLTNRAAERLYAKYARDLPIFDYHCHLSEKQLLADEPFTDLTQLWLSSDHYKWRLMRNFGIDEAYITGNKSPYEKFYAYVSALERAFGNPLYHWSQMELKTYFDCDLEINTASAPAIWKQCNEAIVKTQFSPSAAIRKSNVKCLFTTNSPTDDLTVFARLKEKYPDFAVYPAFRAEKQLAIENPDFAQSVRDLAALTRPIRTLRDLIVALSDRVTAFAEVGCKAADLSIEQIYPLSSYKKANEVFVKACKGKRLTSEEIAAYKGCMTAVLLSMYDEAGFACELHIGALRNVNGKAYESLGADSGFDCIADGGKIENLAELLDFLNSDDCLPPLIVYNLNPKNNLEILALLGAFQSSRKKGKMQYGAAWWFLDNKQGMIKHLNDLTSVGHLDAFLGMLTDSRSFISYPRHDYFRRILCSYLGKMIDEGEITDNEAVLAPLICNVCFDNAAAYFGVELASKK